MKTIFQIILSLAMLGATSAFSSSAFLGVANKINFCRPTRQVSRTALSMRVVDIDSEAAFDKAIKGAGDALVVIDYSTTWCGPCKVIAPKFDELSDKYPDAVFIKVRKLLKKLNKTLIFTFLFCFCLNMSQGYWWCNGWCI